MLRRRPVSMSAAAVRQERGPGRRVGMNLGGFVRDSPDSAPTASTDPPSRPNALKQRRDHVSETHEVRAAAARAQARTPAPARGGRRGPKLARVTGEALLHGILTMRSLRQLVATRGNGFRFISRFRAREWRPAQVALELDPF